MTKAERKVHHSIAVGDVFGRLTVRQIGLKKGRQSSCLCECDCGKIKEVFEFSLKGGKTLSCGAHYTVTDATKRKVSDANRRHGMHETPEYRAWRAMRGRCTNRNHQAYKNYGARGISVCPEWMESFDAFFSHMGPKPSRRHTLERVDNSRGYGPDNCEWRGWKAQNRNRRNTVIVEYRGQSLPLSQVTDERGAPYALVHRRITTFGWSLEDALSKPSRINAGR